jgi:hypothetical protein
MTLSQTSRRALTAGFLLTAVFHTGAATRSKVIPLLQGKGLHVVAVQNPLTSLADEVAATRRAPSHCRMDLYC